MLCEPWVSLINQMRDSDNQKLLAKQAEERNNMTRTEAEKRLVRLCIPRDMSGKYFILEVLEALNVVKFDNEPDFKSEIGRIFGVDFLYVQGQLKKLGYEIVKRDAD